MRITHTTTHLKLPRARLDLPPAASLTIITFCVICIVALVGRIQSEQPSTPAPVIIIATSPAVAVPIATPMQQAAYVPAAPRMVVAFAAPDGDILGPIEAPALGAIVARFGDGWIATMHEGATVWIRVSELGGSLANLAPEVPQLQPVIVYQPAPAPAYQPEPQYQTSNQPEQAPQPAEQPAVAPMMAAPVPQAQPTAPPTSGIFFQQTEVQKALQAEAWRQEHCFGSGEAEVCH